MPSPAIAGVPVPYPPGSLCRIMPAPTSDILVLPVIRGGTPVAESPTVASNPDPGAPTDGANYRRALVHPVFLGALALLVVNDHVLKGSGHLPGWLTGKLSDLAGVIVAPIVLGALTRARSEHRKRAVHAAVALAMIATELSQSTADLVASGLVALGLSGARLVADPSDLWALVLLPVPYVILTPRATLRGVALPRVSLAVAALACVASPQPPRTTTWSTSAYLVNATTTQEDVRIAWTAAIPDCTALAALPNGITLDRVVSPDLFGAAVTFRLEPGETVPLEEVDARAAVGVSRGDAGRRDGGVGIPTSNACQLALVSADGVPDTIVFFSTSFLASVPTSIGSDVPFSEVSVQLHETGNTRSWTLGASLITAAASEFAAPSTCQTARPALALGGPGVDGTLTAIETLPDGCFHIVVTDASASPVSHFLCGVPREMLPFAIGDELQIRTQPTTSGITSSTFASFDLVVSGTTSAALQNVSVAARAPESCNGERTACGAFVLPLAFSLSPPGTPDALGVQSVGSALAFVGRTEDVLLAMPGCEGGRSAPGIHTQLAVARPAL